MFISNSRARRPSAKSWYAACLKVACGIGALTGVSMQVAIAQSGSMVPSTTPDLPQTVLAQAARAVGARRCLAAVSQISDRMFAQTKHTDVALDWDRGNPDGEPVFSLSGLEYPDASAVLSLTTAPSPAGGCTIMVERISSAPTPCKAVARSTLAGYSGTQLVKAVTVYVNPARPRETVTLVDSPPSCLIIRRQVGFNWGVAR
ncbi:hypothetical protein [Burkholderia stagnalis]|uniref:Uncharacterized protein n=2 Tax=Burkholderia stagnalis TaxID=1503054 RepID=A0A6L3N251_9BURK|nr:hypothetical protein [Burkholderia stagnalis]KAB0639965.1 hypothetical protein F7R25_06525 [Burkholderia stagnalis]